MRLLAAEHPFVDGNKRTALNTAAILNELNGYEFRYEDEAIRDILNQFATDAEAVEMSEGIASCRRHAVPAEDEIPTDVLWPGDNEMSPPTEEMDAERKRLRKLARTADSPDERRAAIRQLAALERERNRDTYDKLADE